MTDQAISYAARILGATKDDTPDLWNISGLPALTTNQLLNLALSEVLPIQIERQNIAGISFRAQS